MAYSAASLQTQSKQSELQKALAARNAKAGVATSTHAKEDPFANIKANPIFQIFASAEIAPEDKPNTIAKLLASPQSEADARETMKNFEQIKEYYAAQRHELAEAMIRSQSTETQAELQRSLNDLNKGMLDFETNLKPITDVLDAVYKLSLNDKAYEAFKEIKNDQKILDEANAKRIDIRQKVQNLEMKADELLRKNEDHRNNKNIFGRIKSSAQAEIDKNINELSQIQITASKYKAELDEINKITPPTSALDDDLQESKAVVAKFLNLANNEVKAQQEALYTRALDFIKTNKDRITNMRGLLSTDERSITKMVDASDMLGMVYATVSDACEITSESLKARRSELLPKEGEILGAVEKQIRAKRLADLDRYIETFEKEKGNTLQTTGKVTELQEKLGNLKRSNADGVELTRRMATDAIAEVSEGLMVTLSSLSTAAVGQSANIAKANLARMAALTNDIAQKDSIRGAMSEEQRVAEISESVESLKSWTDVMTTRKDILEGTFTRLKDAVTELRSVTETAKDASSQAASIAAEVATSGDAAKEESINSESILGLNNNK